MNAGAQGLPGMAPGMTNGPGGMPIPLAMMVANMAMTGGGYYVDLHRVCTGLSGAQSLWPLPPLAWAWPPGDRIP